MTMPSIEQLRARYETDGLKGVWGWLMGVLTKHARYRIARYPGATYSPTGVWDEEGVQELIAVFLKESLLGIRSGSVPESEPVTLARPDVLAGLFARFSDSRQVARYLEKMLKNFAINQTAVPRERRTPGLNVFRLLAQSMDEDPRLKPIRIGGRSRYYGLTGWIDNPPPALDEEYVANLSAFIPPNLDLRLVSFRSDRAPGLHRTTLKQLAHALIERSGHLLSPDQVMRVLRSRIDLGSAERPLTKTLGEFAGSECGDADFAHAKTVAHRIFEKMTERQRSIYFAWLEPMVLDETESRPARTVREVTEVLGGTPGRTTVADEVRRITVLIEESVGRDDDPRERVAVLWELWSLTNWVGGPADNTPP